MIVQQIRAKVIFEFKDLPIVMLESKQIYHVSRNKFVHEKLNCRSRGYWVERRFYTRSKLNKLAVKAKSEIVAQESVDCPF